MYFVVAEWDVIWVSVILYTAIFWSLYEAGGISLEKGVRLIDQWTNELSLKGEILRIILQNIQPVRGRMWTWEEADLKSQDNHPLMMMQICVWELKAVRETAEGATETMIHPSRLLEQHLQTVWSKISGFVIKAWLGPTNPQMKDGVLLWCFDRRLWNSKMLYKQSNTYIICFEIWTRVKAGYNPQKLGNKSVIEKLFAVALTALLHRWYRQK